MTCSFVCPLSCGFVNSFRCSGQFVRAYRGQVQAMMEISHVPPSLEDSSLTWLQVWGLMTFLSGVGVQLYLLWIPIRLCVRCCEQHPTRTLSEVLHTQPKQDTRVQQGRQWVWGRNNLHLRWQPTVEEAETSASRFPEEALGH